MLGSNWQKVLDNVRKFIAVLDEFAALGHLSCRVTFQLTFLETNIEELAEIVRIAIELDVGGQLFIIEMLLPDDGYDSGLCDLHVLVSSGGRERAITEFVNLLDECSFDFQEVIRMNAVPSIIVAVAR